MKIRFTLKILLVAVLIVFTQCKTSKSTDTFNLKEIEKDRVLALANYYSTLKPITVTDSICTRSAGGIHDFYSEGDYWWPDPENPNGPYIRKDGLTNPNNFTAHREVMIRFSQICGALTSAYIVTNDKKYIEQLIPHLQAWFINEKTLMNPNLLYGQAISGITTGRGIGIIDTIHLMEVAKAVLIIENSTIISKEDLNKIKAWFSAYLTWITTHEYGISERDNGNNHSVCWVMQAAVFAELTNNKTVLDYCKNMYKNVLLPDQMETNGSFPLEIKRTKPYGYSLFTLDCMTTICQTLSEPKDNLFDYTTPDNKNIGLGISFLYPFIKDKNKWPYPKDVMYWDEWPVRQPLLLFGGLSLKNDSYLKLWKSLPENLKTNEVIRNMPVKYPLLWVKL